MTRQEWSNWSYLWGLQILIGVGVWTFAHYGMAFIAGFLAMAAIGHAYFKGWLDRRRFERDAPAVSSTGNPTTEGKTDEG